MKKKVYLIGNAHLDPVWLWKRREGYAEIKATFQSALDKMEQFDGFVFISACAAYYKWVEENEPAMFAKIKRRIEEGRWAIAGGMWVQPDCNLPSGESFVRHLLYSQHYFLEKFGRIATVGYNVDSFGHNGMLPQLLKKSGIDSYVFMRPMEGENDQLPFLFVWESPDGSQVEAFRIPFGYGDFNWGYSPEVYSGLSTYRAKVLKTKELVEKERVPLMMFYGVGNHGGGPTARCLEELKAIVADDPDIVYASPDDYFRAIREAQPDLPLVAKDLQHCASGCYAAGSDVKQQNRQTENRLLSAEKYDVLATQILQNLPVIKEDLQHHASGCYSADSGIKQNNRRTENRLVSAEKYDVLAASMTGHPSGRAQIRYAYEKLMFNQFHDILCGCSIKEALEEANRYFNAAWVAGEDVAEAALQKLSWNINTSKGIRETPSGKEDWVLWETEGQGAPVVVFNPHSFAVRQLVQLNHGLITGITDEKGNALPLQKVRGPQSNCGDCYNTVFMAEIPAYGYRVYYVYTRKEFPAAPEGTLRVTETNLENDYLRVEFDSATGTIRKLLDKSGNITLIEGGGANPIVIDDSDSDTWAHMIFTFDRQIGRFSEAKFEVVNSGPLLATIRVTSRYNNSVLVQEFSLNTFNAELLVKCRIDFHEQRKLVKLAFPLATVCEKAAYEIPFGFLEKPCNGTEEPGHRYISLSGRASDGKAVSMALINDSKYSFSAQNNEMRMMVARGCGFADHYSDRSLPIEFMDQGMQEFHYALIPHSGKTLAGVTKSAMLLNQQLEYIMETNHEGMLDTVFSGISISAENIVCEAVKFAEKQDALTLRIYETAGVAVKAQVRLNLPQFETEFTAGFGRHEVKTFLVYKDKTVRETNLIEMKDTELI